MGRAFLFAPRALLLLAFSGLLGLSPYAYLPYAGGPTAAWGTWGDCSTLGGFLTRHMAVGECSDRRVAKAEEGSTLLSLATRRARVHIGVGGAHLR
mgnify:CR=1 FL=1